MRFEQRRQLREVDVLPEDRGEEILTGGGQLVGAQFGAGQDIPAAFQPDQKLVGEHVGKLCCRHLLPERFQQPAAAPGIVEQQAVPGDCRAQCATRGAGKTVQPIAGFIQTVEQGLQHAAGEGCVAAATLAGDGDGADGLAGGGRWLHLGFLSQALTQRLHFARIFGQ